ncbi:hypothetical protein TcCL_NonESM04220 [Trypanosoma cruzi]|nr:hypothetical protein TcCL_NonESM04220 [Trypanosoma cruzi]
MMAGEGSGLTLRLQRLYELIATSIENDTGNDARRVPHPNFLVDAAQEYSNILDEAASLPAMQDSPAVIYEALRVVTLLLAFEGHGSSGMSINTGLATKITNCVLEGIERLNILFAMKQPFSLPQLLREELLTVVRLLICPVVQQQSESDQNSLSNSHSSGVINAMAEMARLQNALIDRRLLCARLLIERGLGCCRDMEELLSSSFAYGSVLQQFLLQTLQEEFTTMRRHASGSTTALNGVTDEFTGDIEEGGGGSSSCGENCFCYYALFFYRRMVFLRDLDEVPRRLQTIPQDAIHQATAIPAMITAGSYLLVTDAATQLDGLCAKRVQRCSAHSLCWLLSVRGRRVRERRHPRNTVTKPQTSLTLLGIL